MDPVSLAASLVTLLAAAGAICEFAYNFILDISEVPDEVHTQAIKIRCIRQSFSSLVRFYERSDLPPELHLDPFLENSIRNFLKDISVFETEMVRKSTGLVKSRTRHLKERLTWLSSDRRVRKFYSALDDWMKIFSAAVHTTELFVNP
jgi:hypothetical protein